MVSEKEFREIIDKTEALHLSDPNEEEVFLKGVLSKNLTQSQYIELNLQLAYCFLVLSRYNHSYELYKQMHEFAVKEHDDELFADALEGIGNTQVELGNKKQAKKNLLEAITYYQKLNLPEKESKASNTIAILYFKMNDYDEAIRWYEKAQLLTEDKKSIRFVNALGNSGLIYHSQGNMIKASEIYEKAVNIAKECHYNFVRLIFQEKLGETYRELGNFEKAEENFNEAYGFAIKMKDDKHIGTLASFIANFWLEMGNFAKAYEFLQVSFAHLKKVNFPFGLLDVHYISAQFWLAKGQLQNAKNDLKQALEVIRKNGIFEVQCDVLTLLAEVHDALGETEDANKCLISADEVSRERNSNFQHAMVLLQRARININLGSFNEAIIQLKEVLWIAGESEDLYLIYDSNFLFTQIYLTQYYQNHTNQTFFDDASKYLTVSLDLTKNKHLIPRYINALIIEGLMHSSQNHQKKAKDALTIAKYFAEDARMIGKLREIDERLIVINNGKPLKEYSGKYRNFILAIALEDLRRFTFSYSNNDLSENLVDETFLVVYSIQEQSGFTIFQADNTDLSKSLHKHTIQQMGEVYSLSFSSPSQNSNNIFGPFPFGDLLLSSVLFITRLADTSLVFALVFPKKMNALFDNREKVEMLLAHHSRSITHPSQITSPFLNRVRNGVISSLIADLRKSIEGYHSDFVENHLLAQELHKI